MAAPVDILSSILSAVASGTALAELLVVVYLRRKVHLAKEKAQRARSRIEDAVREHRQLSLEDLAKILEGLPLSNYSDDLHELALKALSPVATKA